MGKWIWIPSFGSSSYGQFIRRDVGSILHDVVEDSHYTFDNLLESGIPTHVVETLRLLTHSKDENYDDYILRIIQPDNKIAIAVKWNDLTHNLERGKRSNHIRQTHGE